MSNFTPINTQEELDAAIGERLKRESDKWETKVKDLEDEISELKSTNQELTETNNSLTEKKQELEDSLADSNAKIKGYETDSVKKRIAREYGLPEELADRITGEDENSMTADAEKLGELFKNQQPKPPMPNPEGGEGDEKTAGARALLESLTEGE